MSYLLLGIELNNFAVEELQKGDIKKAFELLKYSYDYIMKSEHYPNKNKRGGGKRKRNNMSSSPSSKKRKHHYDSKEEKKEMDGDSSSSSSSSSPSPSSVERSYNLKWNDCTVPVTGVFDGHKRDTAKSSNSDMSSVPFLCMKLLTVDMKGKARQTIEEVSCSCEFEWVVWYK